MNYFVFLTYDFFKAAIMCLLRVVSESVGVAFEESLLYVFIID